MADDSRYQRFNLRIPKSLMAQLQAAAEERSHSANAEIVRRLERSFEEAPSARLLRAEEMDVLITSVMRRLADLPPGARDRLLTDATRKHRMLFPEHDAEPEPEPEKGPTPGPGGR